MVFGQEHHLSVDQLGTYLGFYTQDHMNEEDYCNLPNDFDSDAAVEAYWHRISGGNEGGQLRREKRKTSMSPLGLEQLNRSYIQKIDDVPMQDQEQQQPPAQEDGGGQEVPPEYMQYPQDEALARHDEALARHNEALERQNEAFARQEARQNQQLDAIEQIRLWMEQRFPPPSQGGDGSY
nr:hypothetical protein Iba_chr02bCG13760 [Ipomoea batatas]